MSNTFQERQLKEFGKDGIEYINTSQLLKKYVDRRSTAAETSGDTYRSKLSRFLFFVHKTRKAPFDKYVKTLNRNVEKAYDLLADYAAYLKTINKNNEVRAKTKHAYKFLRASGVKINQEDFREKVPLPRQEFPDFEGTEKTQIVELLNNCKNMRLKTALMLYAAMGPRKTQGCAVRECDIDLEKETITFRKEYAKMRVAYTRPLTRELASQIRAWRKFKYRPRHWVRQGDKRVKMTPTPEPEDLVLAMWDYSHKPKPEGIADSIYDEYEELTNRLKMRRKDGRRVITLHRLRAFAKSTISDLGYGDFSEWWIGHKHSTYYRKPEKERLELFRKIEPYLTFLDVAGLERHNADIVSRMEKLEKDNEDYKKRLVELEKEKFVGSIRGHNAVLVT